MAGKSFGAGGFKKRPPEEVEMDITPMIDCTFLLLIFFMVTSNMQSQREFDVPVAKYGVRVDSKNSITIEVHSPSGSDPVILLNGQEAPLDDVPGYVREGMNAGALRVLIKADGNVPTGFVTKVERKAMEVEGMVLDIGVRDQ